MIGKKIRIGRISEKGKYILVPMDHGITIGPVEGLLNLEDTIAQVAEGGATGVIIHKGPIIHFNQAPPIPIIMHVSASTNLGQPNRKVIIGTPDEALMLGTDAFSIHVNVGAETESEMLQDAGTISQRCTELGLPLIAMMYPRGPKISNPFDPDLVAHAARIGYEIGADIVKTVYTGNPDTFKSAISGCRVPVIIAGGPKNQNFTELFQMVSDATQAGASGIAFGRNVFQAKNPKLLIQNLRSLVLEEKSVTEAVEALK